MTFKILMTLKTMMALKMIMDQDEDKNVDLDEDEERMYMRIKVTTKDTDVNYRRLVSTVAKAPVCSAGGQGSIPGRTNTQGLKTTEEKVLPLL